jgi:hypothetical protein
VRDVLEPAVSRPTSTKGRGCGGKRRHATREDAELEVGRKVARGAPNGAYNAYRCRSCGSWHVGHRPGSASRRVS